MRSIPKQQIVSSVDRSGCLQSRVDMNALDPTKILASTRTGTHVYDIRNMNKRVFTLNNGLGAPSQCKWSPHRDFVYAASFAERQVAVTDMGEVDRYSTNDLEHVEKSMIVAAAQQFNHEGHKREVLNFDWNKSENFLFLSNDRDALHIWKLVGGSERRATRYTSLRATRRPRPTAGPTARCTSRCLISEALVTVVFVFQEHPDVLALLEVVFHAALQLEVPAALEAHHRGLRERVRRVSAEAEVRHVREPPQRLRAVADFNNILLVLDINRDLHFL